jgi:hypothetical protein
MLPTGREILQNAWVVADAEAAARRWSETFNIGPFFVAEYAPGFFVDVRYRGQPAELHMKVALSYMGPVQVELVQPLTRGPDCYRDTVPAGQERFHHVCVWSRDLDADLDWFARCGCVAANTGRVKDSVRFAYVDTHAALGCMVELLEYSPRMEKIFAHVAAACRDWDGRDPVRGF